MSHFSVMVLLPCGPDEDPSAKLAAVLQPYHEFECTGVDDKYVVDVDRTEEARAAYARATTTVMVDPAGVAHTLYVDGMYKPEFCEPNPDYPARGGQRRLKVPEGWTQAKAPTPEHETFADWASDYYGAPQLAEFSLVTLGEGTATDAHRALPDQYKYGYTLVNDAGEVVKVVRRTNPNKKWDWYVPGGRWSNKLIDKEGNAGDCCDVSDLDLGAMRDKGVQERRNTINRSFQALSNPELKRPYTTLDEMYADWAAYVAAGGWNAAVAAWEALPKDSDRGRVVDYVRAVAEDSPLYPVRVAHERGLLSWDGLKDSVPDDVADPDAWALEAPPLTAYAMIGLDGQWRAKGEMGWFGMDTPTEGVTPQSWEDDLMVALKAAPAGTVVAIVDCHI